MRVSVLHLISVLALLFTSSGAMKEQAGRGRGKHAAAQSRFSSVVSQPRGSPDSRYKCGRLAGHGNPILEKVCQPKAITAI